MFFSKKPIKITAYTFDKAHFQFAKPEYRPAAPSWLKNLAPFHRVPNPHNDIPIDIPTATYCPGIKDFIRNAITIPAWYDVTVRINSDGSHAASPNEANGENMIHHPNVQMGNEFIKDRIFLKLSSPWNFVCEDDVDFLCTGAFYNSTFFTDNDIINPPGILNFKYQSSTNIHLAFKVKPESYSVDIKYGTPLMSIFPMSEREVQLECKLVSMEEFGNLSNSKFPKVTLGRYYKKLSFLKKNKQL